MQANMSLEQQANKAFPLNDLVPESSVLHARKKWVEAKQYLQANGLEVKAIIGLRTKEIVLQ